MKSLCLAAAFAAAALPACADDYRSAMQSYLETRIMGWASDPVLIDAVLAQNARTADLTQAEIDALDLTWRAEVGTSDAPTITPVIAGPAADFLRARVADAGGTMTEVFVMDARGLNVAASEATSDFWQGDEDKFTQTFSVGPGAVHFGEIAFDEFSQRYQGQVSIALTDPATRTVIGAMTVGLDAESLF